MDVCLLSMDKFEAYWFELSRVNTWIPKSFVREELFAIPH